MENYEKITYAKKSELHGLFQSKAIFLHLEGRLVEEGRLSVHHLYEHDAEGPDVHLRAIRQPGYHLHQQYTAQHT
jgi:hypothetical protein